jgi:spore coat polysaccharide biosynthesis protein SpsF
MKIGFLITVRLKSTRLKRKVLLPLNGFTVIERVIQRAKSVVNSSNIILCTSTIEEDFPLIEYAEKSNINYFLGEPDDVLQRLFDASEKHQITHFIGITADNPLFSIEHAIEIRKLFDKTPSLDFVCTQGMPIGANIYGINCKALETVCNVKEQIDTEIWGPLINRPGIFNVESINAEAKYIRNNYRLTLDEEEDYILFKAIYDNYPEEEVIDLLSAYDFLDKNPQLSSVNEKVVQKELDPEIARKIDDYYLSEREQILAIKERIYNS